MKYNATKRVTCGLCGRKRYLKFIHVSGYFRIGASFQHTYRCVKCTFRSKDNLKIQIDNLPNRIQIPFY